METLDIIFYIIFACVAIFGFAVALHYLKD
jgi:hypothetical protein